MNCPRCQSKGRAITSATLQAQVPADLVEQLDGVEEWSLCTSEACEVVYFHDDSVLRLGETLAVPFHKSEDSERLVCFCFEHSVADIEADLAEHGTSTIRASIKAACGEGRDDCERKNPQGRCCLGNVGLLVKRFSGTQDAEVIPGGCCGSSAAGTDD